MRKAGDGDEEAPPSARRAHGQLSPLSTWANRCWDRVSDAMAENDSNKENGMENEASSEFDPQVNEETSWEECNKVTYQSLRFKSSSDIYPVLWRLCPVQTGPTLVSSTTGRQVVKGAAVFITELLTDLVFPV